jgi:hypothetical protein
MSLPYILNDTYSLSGCTAELSTEQYYKGAKSLKIILTGASTGEYRLCDNIAKNDLHGLYPGTRYALSGYTYLLATGSPTTAEVVFIFGYTTSTGGAWHETSGIVSTGKDAWNACGTTNILIPSGAKSAKALIRIEAAASTDEIIFVDNLRLQPIGEHNLYNQNFWDSSSRTYAGV